MLYSYKERFVPFVKEGSKRQTVRAYRKDGQLPQPGKPVHNYYALRTKHVQKLMEPTPCDYVCTIFIFPDGTVITTWLMDKAEAETKLKKGKKYLSKKYGQLSDVKKNAFAWADGFRPDGTTVYEPTGAFELMLRFWKQTHQLPFTGTVTYW